MRPGGPQLESLDQTHYGLQYGIVVQNKDPDNLDRIKIRLPWLDGGDVDQTIHGETGYSETSRKLAEQFAIQRSLNLRIVDVLEEYGSTIPEIAAKSNRGRNKPCAACGLAKRHIMNQAARIGNFTVLATSHNLDDEAAILFGNTLHWASSYLIRQAPLLEADAEGLIRKVKPLCRIYEREMAAYALLRGIDYVYEECPFATGSTTFIIKNYSTSLRPNNLGQN